jgi:hypothetical protein
VLLDEGRQAGKYRLVAVPFSFKPLSERRDLKAAYMLERQLLILKHTTVKRNSHLGCGFNEKMAHKVIGHILKRSLIFMVLQID